MSLQLSPHFALAEFVRSETAEKFEISNDPPAYVVTNLTTLCVQLLEPLREMVGKPITVNSGYRSLELNELVGGTIHSDHLHGRAADIEVEGMSNMDLGKLIEDSGLLFDQLIYENCVDGDPRAGWIHVGYRAGNNRDQVLVMGGSRRTRKS